MPARFSLLLLCVGLVASAPAGSNVTRADVLTKMKIQTDTFGKLDNGREIKRFRLTNSKGHSVAVMEYGATLLDIQVPDRDGNLANVNLCFENLDSYTKGHPYFGSTVGRYANRIGGAAFQIDGKTYPLTKNHGQHILHGGKDNFAYQPWDGEAFEDADGVGVRFTLNSPAGDNGFPGNVDVVCEYRWNDRDELSISFTGKTDAKTHLNLTNHSYFNLGGMGSGKVLDYVATIHADEVLDVDDDLIPTGKLNSVADSVFDFRDGEKLGKRIDQLPATKGYDHCYVVRGEVGTLRPVAKVVDPKSGRFLEIATTQPGVQLYTANHLGGGPQNAGHSQHEAFCLETQYFPNSPNVDSFPSTLLEPGQELRETTVHRFGVER
ncbi:MAG: aldose epimerase family protein [Planctomycetota bacterium]